MKEVWQVGWVELGGRGAKDELRQVGVGTENRERQG